MSFWQVVERSPEWLTLIANVLFAIITTCVLVWLVRVMRWQGRVMKWQGRNSARHERTQNNLFRLQLEHEFVLRLNAERERILKLTEELNLVAGALKESETAADSIHWSQLLEKVHELNQRLRILVLRVYREPYGKWFFDLTAYVENLLSAVIEDGKFNDTYKLSAATPNLFTRTMLQEISVRHNPTDIRLFIETAIRMEVSDFKDKWDTALKS